MADEGLYAALMRRGMSRRTFLQFTAAMATALALPASYAPRIAAAIEKAPRLPVIWLRGQDCAGDTEAFLRAPDPSTASLLLDVLSVQYHESLMAPAGAASELALTSAMERYPNGYVAVIEGSIPTAEGGAYCLVGGRPFGDVAREVASGALATIAVGACAFDGGIAAAGGGVTGAAGTRSIVSGGPLITLPGCPLNVENLVATLVHDITAGTWPATDSKGRPLFAYGTLVHNECERRPHFEFGEFVRSWGDEGAQKGWCLYKVGCKGPEAFANCPTKKYASGTSWPVRAGHGCIGCTMPAFWDSMSPFYRRLPSPIPPLPNLTADQVGGVRVGGVGALAVVHAVGMTAVQRRRHAAERRAGSAAAGAEGSPAAIRVPYPLPGSGTAVVPLPTQGGEAGLAPAPEPTAPVAEPAPVPEPAEPGTPAVGGPGEPGPAPSDDPEVR